MKNMQIVTRLPVQFALLILSCVAYQSGAAEPLGAGAGTNEADPAGLPPWMWSFEKLAGVVNGLTPGQDLTPEEWPGGARVAVMFSLDVDNETEFLVHLQGPAESMSDINVFELSGYQYGARRGIRRLTDIFDRHQVPATYFMPTVALRLSPDMADVIGRSGRHEIALHGAVHEPASALSPERQRELFEESIAYLEQATGQKPVGYRAPTAIMTEHTIPIMKDLGMLYSSNVLSDDRPFEINLNGKPSGMIELPPSIYMSDGPLMISADAWTQALAPRDVLQTYKDAFDTAYEEGGIWIFVGHPHVSGRRSRAVIIEELIEYMKARGDVWFATHREVAEYVDAQWKR
jgi:peptidoglycan/xylan/chitin deacetylase (PgdA/CDA1 family)